MLVASRLIFTLLLLSVHGVGSHIAAKHGAALHDVFPKETREERRRFKLLDYAYIGARYDPDYRISKEYLEHLSAWVKHLLDRTEKICKSKIERIAG